MTDTNVAETIRYKTHDAPLPSGNIRYHRSGEGRLPTLLFLHGSGPGVFGTVQLGGRHPAAG